MVAGSKAQYKGTGTINGSGTYAFLLTALGDELDTDKFRMKITSGGGGLVYDNKVNVPMQRHRLLGSAGDQ